MFERYDTSQDEDSAYLTFEVYFSTFLSLLTKLSSLSPMVLVRRMPYEIVSSCLHTCFPVCFVMGHRCSGSQISA